MQKLKTELKNVPTNASQVCSSTNLLLNKEETLSVIDGLKNNKLIFNNPDVNRVQHTGRSLQAKVYVLNLQGKPLMPCSYAKSKRMVNKGGAKVVKRFPFTIQLTFKCKNKIQDINLGVDTGYGNIGFSAITEKEELISGTVKLDSRTSKRLTEKRMYRKNRRNRLWYREPRFNNRKRKEGWLPPSIQRRYNTHLNLISRLKKILPISQIIIEIAKFDIQKIENSKIAGKEYQQGNLYEYQNVRNYLMSREKGLCQLCKKDFKGQSSHIHHCKPKNEVGSNRPENLAILHKKCHKKLHEQGLKLPKPKEYKASTFMSIINKRFWKDIPNLIVTYGNITFVNRNKLGIEKTHYNDAFVIANGKRQKRYKPKKLVQIHRNNRVLQLNRKGFKPSIKKDKSKANPGDLFWIGKKQYTCKGMHSKGRYITFGLTKNKEYFKFLDVTKIFHFGSLIWN